MANTNTDLIRDQLMEAYESCMAKDLFLSDMDRSVFFDHLADLMDSLDVIVDEFEVEEDELTKFEAMGGEFELPNNCTECSDREIIQAIQSEKKEEILL